MLPTLSPRQKAGLACALALLLWAPMGISHGDSTLIVAHTTFYNGDTFSPCLASLAGIMRNRVMWFDDQVLVETYGGKGTFIYLTEADAEDPREMTYLFTEGVFYDFVDPNGAAWHVEELFHERVGVSAETPINQVDDAVVGVAESAATPAYENRTYVWVVELSARPIYDEFAGGDPHTYYNFLSLVDTCKMHNNTRTYDGEEQHGIEKLNADNGHRPTDDEHHHAKFMVDIWVGKRPKVVPFGAVGDGVLFETQWAGSQAPVGEDEAQPDNGMAELP